MGEISRTLGTSATIKHDGKEYKLSPITAEIMGEWEEYLADRAWENIRRRMPKMSAAEYELQSKFLQRDINAGEYGFFSAVSDDARRNPFKTEARHFLSLRLRANHPEVDGALIFAIIEEHFAEVMAAAERLDAPDPNSQPPATTKPGTADGA